jgi:hypothetical protein
MIAPREIGATNVSNATVKRLIQLLRDLDRFRDYSQDLRQQRPFRGTADVGGGQEMKVKKLHSE